MFAGPQTPRLSQRDLDPRVCLALGVTLNACLRIALERPSELDPEELVDLVTGLLVAGPTLPPTGRTGEAGQP